MRTLLLAILLAGCCSTQQTTTTSTAVHRDTVKVPVPFGDSAHISFWTLDSIQVVHDTLEVPKWRIKIVKDTSGTAHVSVTPETLYVPRNDSLITSTTTTTTLSFWERFKTNWQIVLLGFAAGVVVIGVIIFLIKK